jgi:RNA-dependent RNA polymerase
LDYPKPIGPPPQRPAPLSDGISQALKPYMERALGTFANLDDDVREVAPVFRRYADELKYICVTHSLSDSPESRLMEEEVVVGTITATCSQHRFRNDRTYRMRLHAKMLVDTIRRKFYGRVEDMASDEGREAMQYGLQKAWWAWDFAMRNRHIFGANSFALIALAVIGTVLSDMGVVMTKIEGGGNVGGDSGFSF